jgi:hypothetical protein
MFDIRRYTAQDFDIWNAFVCDSKNGTFLFNREYMDYHSDRFQDYSLLALDKQGRIIALMPANRTGSIVSSHAGLTYGGVISDQRMTTPQMLEVLEAIVRHLKADGIKELEYKTMPSIYHKISAQEDLYALFRLGARLKRRDTLSIIDYPGIPDIQERRLRGGRKAEKKGVKISETQYWEEFWRVLSENLLERYERKPVHTLNEILLLRDRFPSNIRLFTAEYLDQVIGGAVMYCTDSVAHVQYIASNPVGRENHALDLLFVQLIKEFSVHRYFDFGISTEHDGQVLNQGLIDFKEGFGARAQVHDHYVLPLT